MRQTFVFDRRLNRLDALHAFLGEVERCNVAMSLVAVLERSVPWEEMRDAVEHAAHEVPRLQDVLRPAPWSLGPPVWVRAAKFDIAHQARLTELAAGSTWDDVLRHVDTLQSTPFAPGRPPWQLDYLVGAPSGRSVIVLKLHHSLSDGTALAVMLSKVFMQESLAAAGVEITAVATPEPASRWRELRRHWGSALKSWWRTARATRASGWREERNVLADFLRRSTPWPQAQHAPARRSAMFRVPLASWQACADERSGGVNELYLAIATTALRRYRMHVGIDDPGRRFRVVMPVDVRDDAGVQDGGNVTGAGILDLSGNPEDLGALEGVREVAVRARERASAARPTLVDETLALLPGSVQARALFRRFANKDLLATNVVVPLQCEVRGANVEMVFMVPPVIGPAASFALAGYGDALHLVLNMDTGIVRAPDAFAEIVEETLGEVLGDREVLRMTGSALDSPRA
jgi:diacylglycerol O-acyltransferase